MVRVGVIGAGGIAGVHLDNLKNLGKIEIVALADISERTLKSRIDLFGGTPYSDYREMLAKEHLQGVLLCTPATLRTGPIRACAEAGVPVFIEKPPALDTQTAAEIAQVLKETGLDHSVGFMFRYLESVQRAKQLLADRPLFGMTGLFLCDMVYPEARKILAETYFIKELSGGLIGEQGIDFLDLFRYLSGSEAVSVTAIGNNIMQPKTEALDTEETVALQVAFRNGVVAGHFHSWAYPRWEASIRIFGQGIQLTVDLLENTLEGTVDGINLHESFEGNQHYAEMAAFIRYLETGEDDLILCRFPDAVRSLELAQAAERSLTDSQTVHLGE